MSTITLKDVPPALHATLKRRARSNGTSLNREVIAILTRTLHASRIDAASIASRARAVRENAGVYVTQTDLDALKDDGRE